MRVLNCRIFLFMNFYILCRCSVYVDYCYQEKSQMKFTSIENHPKNPFFLIFFLAVQYLFMSLYVCRVFIRYPSKYNQESRCLKKWDARSSHMPLIPITKSAEWICWYRWLIGHIKIFFKTLSLSFNKMILSRERKISWLVLSM